MEAYCTGYKQFLDAGKTERECVDRAVALAETAGFREYKRGMDLKAGDNHVAARFGMPAPPVLIVCKRRTGACGTDLRVDQKTDAVHSFRSICQCI